MLHDKLQTNLNENKETFSLFLDLRKAFDSVSHPILIKKLYRYGFSVPVFNLLPSRISNRKICTMIEKKVTKLCSVNFGVPEDSVLESLLFLLCVNDLPNASEFEVT